MNINNLKELRDEINSVIDGKLKIADLEKHNAELLALIFGVVFAQPSATLKFRSVHGEINKNKTILNNLVFSVDDDILSIRLRQDNEVQVDYEMFLKMATGE